MHICYVDEAGCTGTLPTPTAPIQPAFVLVGVVLPLASVSPLTTAFLQLKRRFFPTLAAGRLLDAVRFEVKGSDLRKDIALGTNAQQRYAIGFLDKTIALLEHHGAKIFGRLWIKGVGTPVDGTAIYTFSIQDICKTFQTLLETTATRGFMIADSRNKPKNSNVSHSIFTQKFRSAGDPFGRILEMPTFGHSDNHVGLQIADLVASAFLFPLAMNAYCAGHVTNLHVRPGYSVLAPRYAARLKALQYRYQDPAGKWRGGLTVSDPIAQRSSAELFRVVPATTNAASPP